MYDTPHLGHYRTYISFDYARRFSPRPVFFAMGMTDVDDKIVKVAKGRGHDCLEGMKAVTTEFEGQFWEGMSRVGVQMPDRVLRVTEHMQDILDSVSILISKGSAYHVQGDGVYFDTKHMNENRKVYGYGYGDYFNRGNSDGDATLFEWSNDDGSSNRNKRSRKDFALWKCATDGETMAFDSPWGRGRPGWHIECSTFIRVIEANLSERFGTTVVVSMHGGGKDLKFPHHENEAAQSLVMEDGRDGWIQEWKHTGHLMVGDGVKMSKSDKTGVDIDSVEPDVFRWWCLAQSGRWDKDATWSADRLKECLTMVSKVREFLGSADSSLLRPPSSSRGWEIVEDFERVRDEQVSKGGFHDSVKIFNQLYRVCRGYLSGEVDGLAAERGRREVKEYLIKAGFSSWIFGSEGGPDASALSTARNDGVFEVLEEFRNDMRKMSLSSIKGGGGNLEASKVLEACDRVRDDDRLKEIRKGAGGDKKVEF